MSEIVIETDESSVLLKTKGKNCDKDIRIIFTGSGSGGNDSGETTQTFDWAEALSSGDLNNKSISFSGDYTDIQELYNWLLDNSYGGGDNATLRIQTSTDYIVIYGGYYGEWYVGIESEISTGYYVYKTDESGGVSVNETRAMPMGGGADHTVRSISFCIGGDPSYYGEAYESESGQTFVHNWLNEHIIVS